MVKCIFSLWFLRTVILLLNFLKAFYSIASIHLCSFGGGIWKLKTQRRKNTILHTLKQEEIKIQENLLHVINTENLI